MADEMKDQKDERQKTSPLAELVRISVEAEHLPETQDYCRMRSLEQSIYSAAASVAFFAADAWYVGIPLAGVAAYEFYQWRK